MKPACVFNKCDIVDIAPDIELNRKVEAFFTVEALDTSPAYVGHAKKVLRDSGLDEETPSTILAMRTVLSEHRNSIPRSKK